MRRVFVWFLLLTGGLVTLLITPAESEGCHRWRWRRCATPCTVVSSECQPIVIGPTVMPAHPAHVQALAMPAVQPTMRTITTPKGRTYRLIERHLPVRHEADLVGAQAELAAIPPEDAAAKSRRAAKISFVDGAPQVFNTIHEFRQTLTPEATMLGLNIPWGNQPGAIDSNRVTQENHNVTVTCYIYAYKRENDHDYHVIVGDSPNDASRQFINSEVTGLPPNGPQRATLALVRNQFKTFFGIGSSGPDQYVEVDPPLKAKITGSIFYDMDHAPPRPYVGHQSFQPGTAWEIHPITAIELDVD